MSSVQSWNHYKQINHKELGIVYEGRRVLFRYFSLYTHFLWILNAQLVQSE